MFVRKFYYLYSMTNFILSLVTHEVKLVFWKASHSCNKKILLFISYDKFYSLFTGA